MDYEEIWEKATVLLREDLPDVSYKTWIASSLKPVALADDRLYLEVVSDFMRKTILGRYQELISNAVQEVAGRALTVEYMTPQERAAWQGRRREEGRETKATGGLQIRDGGPATVELQIRGGRRPAVGGARRDRRARPAAGGASR